MSYKPHLQSLVDDLKSNPSLIHDPSFRALRALFASEFDAKFPQQKQEEKDDEKNNDAKNEEQQEREENDAVHIDDPDVVGPESEPVPEENTQDPNKQLTDEEANLVRVFLDIFLLLSIRDIFASDVSLVSLDQCIVVV